jgi:hypothetical protein
MQQPLNEPKTFAEMVLVLLEDRFPWLGSDEPVSGADTVEQLSALHQRLLQARVPTGVLRDNPNLS